nr:MAG TPA: DNA polymerase B [Caudoviricetes sp.]
MMYSADFETTTNLTDCRVWAWAVVEIGNINNIRMGTRIDELLQFCYDEKETPTLYFHNLKFDGEFIIYWLFHNGYEHVENKKQLGTKKFCTLISDKGQFYSIEICFLKNKRVNKRVVILDSLKVLPFSVAQIAKAFNLPMSKLEIDYSAYRSEDHVLTDEEKEYIKNDVTIVAEGLQALFLQNLTKMTTGANALHNYKDIVGKKNFDRYFPVPPYDADIRKAYKGGFTYLNPKYKEKDVGVGIVLDVNSLYPSVMYYNRLPYGEGIYFNGQYEFDGVYNLYVQRFSCQFEIKDGMIPTIQLKNNLAFVPTEYVTSSNGEYITLSLTSVDLELFFEHYDVFDITYIDGWKFKSTMGLFSEYIDKWNAVKVQATKDKNGSLRTIAKLMLNSLYGKFALNPKVQSKYPYLGDDDIIHYRFGEIEDRKPIYIPVGVFITAWARYKTITSAQKVYDRFIYADTDSLHLEGEEIPKDLEIDATKLGAWKHESTFTRARFLRQKCYIEDIDNNLKITCAGMPENCYQYVTWDNFHTGASYAGKLKINHTQGGIVLSESPHTLR